jgi:hypothetical protein
MVLLASSLLLGVYGEDGAVPRINAFGSGAGR